MKRVLLALALVSSSLFGVARADKLAFVDMRRAIQECAEGKLAQKKLADALEIKQKELDAERVKLKEMSDALTKEESVLKPDELEKRRRAMRERYYEIERNTNAMRAELRKKEAEAVRPLREKMLVAIAVVAQREKVTHVLHSESILWTESQAMDITNEVIRMTDSAHAKSQEKAAEKPAEKPEEKPAEKKAE